MGPCSFVLLLLSRWVFSAKQDPAPGELVLFLQAQKYDLKQSATSLHKLTNKTQMCVLSNSFILHWELLPQSEQRLVLVGGQKDFTVDCGFQRAMVHERIQSISAVFKCQRGRTVGEEIDKRGPG